MDKKTEALTGGINPWQSVEGMVKDYEKQVAREDAAASDPDDCSDVPKEAMEPNAEAIDLVRRGRLNPETGTEISPTSKTRSAQLKQFGRVSDAYLRGYDAIRWD